MATTKARLGLSRGEAEGRRGLLTVLGGVKPSAATGDRAASRDA
jgi:hypothetical protein